MICAYLCDYIGRYSIANIYSYDVSHVHLPYIGNEEIVNSKLKL